MFECPRRAEMALWGVTGEKWADFIDAALDPAGHPVLDDDGNAIPPQDHWRDDGTCSYCGGITPEALFEAIAIGATIVPTDKNYKVYVEGGRRIGGGVRHYIQAKFYMHHLNRADAAKLRKLIDSGAITIGYPGHFYNGLWLAQPKASE